MALPYDTEINEVLLRIKNADRNPHVGKVTQAVLKEGPQAYRAATLLQILNPTTKEHHHYELKIDHIDRTKKHGWDYKPNKSVRLSGEKPDEVLKLHIFLAAIYSDELDSKSGKVHVVTAQGFAKFENIVEAIPNLADAEKLEVVKGLFEQIDADDFSAILQGSSQENLRKITAAAKMVEYSRAYEVLMELVADSSTGEQRFQEHLQQHPWMFGSEYSELLPRRTWTRDDNLDYMLRRTVDGYLEIIEIKTADDADLFRFDTSHESYYASSRLSKVVGQVTRYLEEVERNRDSILASDQEETLKIRARVIVGRDGDQQQLSALRNYNSHLVRIVVLTFDQLLRIAQRVLTVFEDEQPATKPPEKENDVPF